MTFDPRTAFLHFSAALTGFSAIELSATGMADAYFDAFTSIVGTRMAGEMWQAWASISPRHPHEIESAIRDRIYGSPRFAPLAQNIIVMWYLGQWQQLPDTWRNAHGAFAGDTDHVISAQAYKSGLVWPLIGTHPQGANQPGFASWAEPPHAVTRAANAKTGRS